MDSVDFAFAVSVPEGQGIIGLVKGRKTFCSCSYGLMIPSACLLTCIWLAPLVSLPLAGQSLVKPDHPFLFSTLAQSSRSLQRLCLVFGSA
jgi:hypothetical protein